MKSITRFHIHCVTTLLACMLIHPSAVRSDDAWSDDWLSTMNAAEADGERPVLVKYEASWCGPCQLLNATMQEPDIKVVLKDFHLIRIDVDAPPEGADVRDINAMPTMRILSPDGQRIDENVGLMEGDSLKQWLRDGLSEFRDAQVSQRLLAGLNPDRLDDAEIEFLVDLLDDRSPQRRSAAAGFLMEHPTRVAGEIVQTALEGTTLRQRTAAWSILRRWPAPTDEIDPWEPTSLTDDRVAALRNWASEIVTKDDMLSASGPDAMAETTRIESELELDRLIRRGPVREGLVDALALVGPAILPRVSERLAAESSDAGRERLSAVRYRLIASPSLALRVPGAAEQLASLQSGPRRAATQRIADQAMPEDLALLETLFGHEDPLVRELALRGMQSAGGGTAESLVRLLDDPDKNVRVAVLKLWLDNPSPNLIAPVSEQAMKEEDPGLLSYYIRLIKTINVVRPASSEALQKLAEHADWQVRAEVAGVIAEHASNSGSSWNKPPMPAAYQTIARKLLNDSDSFVLSQIVPPILERDQEANFDRLIEIAWKHPEIRNTILTGLPAERPGPTTLQLLNDRLNSDVDDDRVFALRAMTHFNVDDLQGAIETGLRDSADEVRIAAVRSLSVWLDRYRAQLPVVPKRVDDEQAMYDEMIYESSISVSASSDSAEGTWLGAFASLFGGGEAETDEAVETDEADQTDEAEASVELEAAMAAEAMEADIDLDELMTDEREDFFMVDGEVVMPMDDSQPDAGDSEEEKLEAAKRYDAWLAGWRQSPSSELPWLENAAEILGELRNVADPEGRAHATLVAARLGNEVSLESLRDAFQQVDDPATRLASLYPWLDAASRPGLFELVDEGSDGDEMLSILFALAQIYDPADAEDLFWKGLRRFELDSFDSGWSSRQALMQMTTGQRYFYGDPSSDFSAAATALAERLQTIEEPVARLVGLSVLGEIDPQRTRALIGDDHLDATVDQRLRRDWARFRLSLSPPTEFVSLAVEFLDDDDLRPVGLTAIAQGYDGVAATELGGLSVPNVDDNMNFTGRLQVASIPAGVDPEVIRNLLTEKDAETVAMATYVLAVLDDDISLDALVDAAEQESFEFGGPMTELLVQAIAYRDDDSMVNYLETIYQTIEADANYYASNLYWKIRIMTGPNALTLRKRMRDDFGMDSFL